MAMAISFPRYTISDLERFPNDGNRYELLDGVMIPGHAQVVGPGALTVLPRTQLEPEILVYPSRYAIDLMWEEIDEHWLAVEVLSRSSRIYDREIKRDAYIALGVEGVWL